MAFSPGHPEVHRMDAIAIIHRSADVHGLRMHLA
jgi:hypothetical protein